MSLLTACGLSPAQRRLSERIEQVWEQSDRDVAGASEEAERIGAEMQGASERVQMQYDLLSIRLRDKRYEIPSSADSIRRVLAYFSKHGSEREQMRAHYYMGSVYRDFQDTPHALEHFLQAAEMAERAKTDSLMLRNTYSNLHCLFYEVLDHKNAYQYAMKEYRISQEIGETELTCLLHVGMTYAVMDSLEQAKRMREYTFDTIMATPKWQNRAGSLCFLLTEFAFFKDKERASKCYEMVERLNISDDDNDKCYAYGEYYELMGKKDSAVIAYNRILQNKTGLMDMYNAAKALFFLYYKEGDIVNTNEYAKQYILVSDSLDLGKRQEMAATVNNAFKYYRDRDEEARIISEKERFQKFFILAIATAIIIVLLSVFVFIYRKNRHLKEMLRLSDELSLHRKDKERLKADILAKEEELGRLEEQRQEMEDELRMKMVQNRELMRIALMEQTVEQEGDVVEQFRRAARGGTKVTEAMWKELFAMVDRLYPTFKDEIQNRMSRLSMPLLRTCYLMKIGMSNSQIEAVMEAPHQTVWYRVRKIEQVMGDCMLQLSLRQSF